MPSKLGPHCLRGSNGARKIIDAGCNIVKLVDDFGLAPELANKPNVTLIGRVYASNPRTAEEQMKSGEAPETAARRFIDSQKEKYRLNPAIKIWEGHNEPVWGSQEEMQWYAAFDAARLKILADMGLRGVIACFATGNPGNIELWKWYIPAVQAAKQFNGILGLHEYSSPWVWWMSGNYQMNSAENEGDEGWTTLRYRKVMHKFLKPEGCDDVQIAITEFGLDRVGPVPQGASSGNWRTNADWWPAHNGARDPIDYWRNGGRDAERYYAEQMMWYDREMRKDANVLGATIYTFGYLDPAWKDYDVDGTRVVDVLCDYIKREANVADAMGRTTATQPPVQPSQPSDPAPRPEPPPDSQPVIVLGPPPGGGAVTGLNLLNNPNFENGHYHWHNVPEIVIPNGWDFEHKIHTEPKLPQQDIPFDPPECVVWNKASAPLEERSLFFLSGDYCLKIFKGWGAIWWRLFQKVDGLTPGQRYRFTVPIHPDLVMQYDKGRKIYADDPLAGEVRLSAKSGSKVVENGWLDGTKFPFGKYTPFTLDFVAEGPSAEVSAEGRGRWGLINNGWFVDSLKLELIDAGAIIKPTTPQPPIAPQPQPPVTPQPPAGPQPPVGAQPSGPLVRSVGEFLQNPNFTAGVYQPNPNVRDLAAPNGWQLWWADETMQKLPKQKEPFKPPKAGVVTPANANPDDLDGLTGELKQAYRVVGNWRAIWFKFSQTVRGLTPTQRYRLAVQMMPDPVDKYSQTNNKIFVGDPDGGEVILKSNSGGQMSETLKRVQADFLPGQYTTFTHEFTATSAEATVTLEVRARFALTQNAWYVASASLQGV